MTDSPGIDEVPDADRLEQQAPAVAPDIDSDPVSIPIDVPEADALEQSLPGPLPDEDEGR